MLAPASGRDRRVGALDNLQQRLLHALAGNVAGDGQVFRLACHLVDLVDVDDANLRAVNVVVGRIDNLQQDALDIFTHVARLGKRRGVRDGKGHVEYARECLGQ